MDGKYSFSPLAVVKFISDDNFLVYPGITTSILNVVHQAVYGNNSVEIYSLNGQKVKLLSADQNSSLTTINVSSLSPGVYIVSFTNGSTFLRTKFIKQ